MVLIAAWLGNAEKLESVPGFLLGGNWLRSVQCNMMQWWKNIKDLYLQMRKVIRMHHWNTGLKLHIRCCSCVCVCMKMSGRRRTAKWTDKIFYLMSVLWMYFSKTKKEIVIKKLKSSLWVLKFYCLCLHVFLCVEVGECTSLWKQDDCSFFVAVSKYTDS